VIGFTPRQVDELTIWEFNACCEAYIEANGGKKKPEGGDMDDADLRALGVVGF